MKHSATCIKKLNRVDFDLTLTLSKNKKLYLMGSAGCNNALSEQYEVSNIITQN